MNLMDYAKARRFRTRNLHDGRPLHPVRVPVGGRGRSAGYIGDGDRMDAVIGKHGYIVDEGGGRLGWYVFAKSRLGLNKWLPLLRSAGATVKQEAHDEAAGDAPESSLEALIKIIRPYRRHSGQSQNQNNPGWRASVARRIDANTPGGVNTPPPSKMAL